MKKFLMTLLVFVASFTLKAQNTSIFTKAYYISGKDSLPYRLLYPADYDPKQRYPLILFLHGAGERGKDNQMQLGAMPKALTDSVGRQKYASFILVPQCAKNDVWVDYPGFPKSLEATKKPTKSAQAVFDLLEQLMDQLPVDDARIYITGYSMGGEGTFDFLTRKPDLFAAAAPICSVSDTSKANLIYKIPIWAFHGDQDPVNNVKYSRLMIDALKKQGGHPKYTEYPGVQHNSWLNAYRDPALFEWMFAQKKH